MIRFILSVLLVSSSASAAIEWEQNEINLKAHPTQLATEAVFHFSNTGDDPVSLSDVVLSCGCLSAKPTKPSYAPGEEGFLTITLDLRNRAGKLHKTVQVVTSDGEEQELAISVDVPKAYEMSAFIRWVKGEETLTKSIRLVNTNAIPIRLLSLTSSHEALPAELKTIREGYEYEVVVTRKPDAGKLRSVIRVQTEPPPGQQESKILKLYAVVL